jgi:hypothetical protein
MAKEVPAGPIVAGVLGKPYVRSHHDQLSIPNVGYVRKGLHSIQVATGFLKSPGSEGCGYPS